VVSDPSDDVPRETPAVSASLEARFEQTPPASQAPITGEDLLETVRCRTAGGGPCLSGTPGDEPLSNERTHEIVERYHALVQSEDGRRHLVAAFEPLGALAPGVEGEVLYGVLASRRALAPAREAVDELAAVLTQVSLLGIDPAGTERVRGAIASDFADASQLPGLDVDLVLATVTASGVGALP
jgi:hypothetical protein